LQNVLEKVAMLSDKTRLGAADLDGIAPADTLREADSSGHMAGAPRTYAAAIEDCERQLLSDALAATQGRVEEAAKRLGLGRATLYRKLSALGLSSHYRDLS
jgi:transcriptional regulator of acetoin/glycerol metabolism